MSDAIKSPWTLVPHEDDPRRKMLAGHNGRIVADVKWSSAFACSVLRVWSDGAIVTIPMRDVRRLVESWEDEG